MESDGRTTIGSEKMKIQKIFICFLIVLISLFISISTVKAAEGKVTTGGKIIFYEELKGSSETSTPPSNSGASKPNSKKELPSTGESVKNYAILLGSGLLIITLFLFWRKRRKEEGA